MKSNLPKLRREQSLNCSGTLKSIGSIEVLKREHYRIQDINLDGDAPKQFIKVYSYKPFSTIRKANQRTWIPYIAKSAEKWYPHESVVEYMINRIGEVLGLGMNGVRLVQANGQIRFLSQYFLKPDQALIHGAEVCGQYLEDMDLAARIANDRKTAREFFTFEFIEQAIKSVFPQVAEAILADLVKMIVFDAVVGNNDRHFYNWAVIRSKSKSHPHPTFAPIYDSARGLLWNISDEKILDVFRAGKNRINFVAKYVKNAYPRVSLEGGSNIDHFQLLSFLREKRPAYSGIISSLTSLESQQRAVNLVKAEFGHLFIPARTELTIQILEDRFSKARTS